MPHRLGLGLWGWGMLGRGPVGLLVGAALAGAAAAGLQILSQGACMSQRLPVCGRFGGCAHVHRLHAGPV